MLTKNEVIVTYSIVCVTTPGGHAKTQAEGWGYMLYNWKTHHIDQSPRDVFKPRQERRGDLAVEDRSVRRSVNKGMVTFFSSQCTKLMSIGCATGNVWSSATVKATTGRARQGGQSYKIKPLITDGSGKWQPLSISVGRYGNGLRLVEMETIIGTYRIFTAPTAGARWHLKRIGHVARLPDADRASASRSKAIRS